MGEIGDDDVRAGGQRFRDGGAARCGAIGGDADRQVRGEGEQAAQSGGRILRPGNEIVADGVDIVGEGGAIGWSGASPA
ncbi:MAG: hypothetical protein WDN04_01145 [Rhodospirillales bacterium]